LTQEYRSLREDNSEDSRDELIGSVWASGALIQDKLFAYGLVSYGKRDEDTWFDTGSNNNSGRTIKNPTWLLKMDWNINDGNKLELTAFSDKQKTEDSTYLNTPGTTERGDLVGTQFSEAGGENYIAKY